MAVKQILDYLALIAKNHQTKNSLVVKDEGIYIMDNYVDDDKRTSAEKGTVIYAKGYDLKQDDLWEKTYMVSGDDFAESIPLNDAQILRLIHGADLVIYLTDTHLKISTVGGDLK